MKNKIIIVSGDSNSINSEIICKMWNKTSDRIKKKIYLITNFEMFKKQVRKLGFRTKLIKVKNIKETFNNNNLKIIDINLNFKDPFKVSYSENSKFVLKSLSLAHTIGMDEKVKGIINCPIDKKLLQTTGKVGVTEFFASKNNIKNNSEVMLIYNKNFSVVPLTTHIKVDQISKKIEKKLIIQKIKTLGNFFRWRFRKNPKIGMLGLNPHNSEFSKNSKEVKVITPSILNLKKKGYNIKGPYSADTMFVNDYKNFDIVVGMYHDQILTPFKTIFKFDAINITLGLKYIRVSPDHGTAKNLIKKNKSNPLSLIRCVEFLDKIN